MSLPPPDCSGCLRNDCVWCFFNAPTNGPSDDMVDAFAYSWSFFETGRWTTHDKERRASPFVRMWTDSFKGPIFVDSAFHDIKRGVVIDLEHVGNFEDGVSSSEFYERGPFVVEIRTQSRQKRLP